MNKRELARLQRLIDKTTAANNVFRQHENALMEFCRERYGYEPGDIDADQIIDAILGGMGAGEGMDAAQFNAIMTEDKP